MIRVVVFLVVMALLALGFAWIAERPGTVEILWLNHHISTSVTVVAAVLLVAVAAIITLWSLLRGVIGSPHAIMRRMRSRRIAKGQHAIVHGLIAVGAGDARAAAASAQQANRFIGNDPLALLLTAQSAQLAGDRAAAEQTFTRMAARHDTKLLGLHGLYIEARRRNDAAAARAAAEEAARVSPSLAWAGRAALEYRCASGDWAGALEALDRGAGGTRADKAAVRRQRAVLLTAHARDLAQNARERAKVLALEAAKLAPDLVPAAALAGRFLAEDGDARRAARVVEAAWRANPHPDLAEIYMNLRPGDSTRDRLVRVEKLASSAPGSVESALAVARAAIDAQDFAAARSALKPLLLAPTQRVAMLMAQLEEAESNDIGRAREWMARALRAARDPAWTADGFVSDRWMPVSPSGRLDAFEWKVPVTELPGAVIEMEPETAKAIAASGPPAEAAPAAAPPPPVNEATPTISAVSGPPMIETVIPLVKVPDDPGPDHEPAEAPVAEPRRDGWSRLRSLFG